MKFRDFMEMLGYDKRLPKEEAFDKVVQAARQIFGDVKGDQHFISVKTHGKRLSLAVSGDDWLTLNISFNWQGDRTPDYNQMSGRESEITPVHKTLQAESLGFMKALQSFIATLNPLGVRVKFLAAPGLDKKDRRGPLYARMLIKSGYQQTGDTWTPAWMLL